MKLLTFLKKLSEDVTNDKAARQARAQAMGFDTSQVWYHANTGGIEGDGFDNDRLPSSDPDRPFNAHWFSHEPSEHAAYPSSGNTITPVYLKLDKSKEAPHGVWRKVAAQIHKAWDRGDNKRNAADMIREKLVSMGYTHAVRGREQIDAEELKRTGETSFMTSTGTKVTLKWEKMNLPPQHPEYTDDELAAIHAYRDAKDQYDRYHVLVVDTVVNNNGELTPEQSEKLRLKAYELKGDMDRTKELADAADERAYEVVNANREQIDSLQMYDSDVGHVTGYSDLADYENMSPEKEDVAVLDPSIIRSVHAEFNPDEAGSNKLMASIGESQPTRPPMFGYHSTFPDNRDNIRMHGLDPKYSDTFEEGAVFFATGGTPDPKMDIWKADLSGLDIEYDPTQEGGDSEHWWYTHQLVVPDRLTLVQKGTG